MMIYNLFLLYIVFLKIGLFSFGGGYIVLSLIQKEIVYTYNWITLEEFTNIIAVSQVTPGAISVNAATYVGYNVTGSFIGSIVATFGLATPSIVIMYIFTKFFLKFRNNKYITNTFTGLKVIVISLILSVGISLINNKNFIDLKSYIIFIISLILLIKYKINPILLIIITALLGIILY